MVPKLRIPYAWMILLLIGLAYISPQLYFRYPSLLDMSESFIYGKSFMGFTETVFGEAIRFRPLFIAQRILLNWIFDYHIRGYFMTYGLLLGVTIALLNEVWSKEGVHVWDRWLLLFMLLVSPIAIDTYWRLGTAENAFALVLVFCVYLMMRNAYGWFLAASILLMTAKENAVAVIPIFIMYFIVKRKYVQALSLAAIYGYYLNVIWGIISRYARPDSYLSLFSLKAPDTMFMMGYYIRTYPLLFIALGVSYLVLSATALRKKHIYTGPADLALLGMPIALFGSVLVFRNPGQAYYLFPLLLSSIVVIGRSFAVSSPRLRLLLGACFGIVFMASDTLGATTARMIHWQRDYAGDAALLQYIDMNDTDTFAFSGIHDEYDNGMRRYLRRRYSTDTSSSSVIIYDFGIDNIGKALDSNTVWGESWRKWSVSTGHNSHE